MFGIPPEILPLAGVAVATPVAVIGVSEWMGVRSHLMKLRVMGLPASIFTPQAPRFRSATALRVARGARFAADEDDQAP